MNTLEAFSRALLVGFIWTVTQFTLSEAYRLEKLEIVEPEVLNKFSEGVVWPAEHVYEYLSRRIVIKELEKLDANSAEELSREPELELFYVKAEGYMGWENIPAFSIMETYFIYLLVCLLWGMLVAFVTFFICLYFVPPNQVKRQKTRLKKLILSASKGNNESAQSVLDPFIAEDEEVLYYGISAKFGLIFPTYDFIFLTDRRVGDLEINVLTGAIKIEVAYLHRIDAIVLAQPAIPIILRLLFLMLYPLIIGAFAILTIGFTSSFNSIFLQILFVALACFIGFSIGRIVNSWLKKVFLRFRKSGLYCRLHGVQSGTLIFADRDKFSILSNVTNIMADRMRMLEHIG